MSTLHLPPEQLRVLDEGEFKARLTEAADFDRTRSGIGTMKSIVDLARRAQITAMRLDDGLGDRAALVAICAELAGIAMRLAVEGSALLPGTRFAPGALAFPDRKEMIS